MRKHLPKLPKPKKKVHELVTVCDCCKKPLGRTCARTIGSSVCAEGRGIVTKKYFNGDIRFFCCKQCANEDKHPI